jgi:hypothetical protein
MQASNPQTQKTNTVTGAVAYRTRSDPTATPAAFLVAGSQNMLINEATDREGDKIESRPGYELFGQENTDLVGVKSEKVFRTKVGVDKALRFLKNGDLEYYDAATEQHELLKEGLDGDYPCRFTTWWDGSELLRLLLFVNHSDKIWSWSGATATLDEVTNATTIVINETIATRGFRTAGTRSIRIKDATGIWREAVYTAQVGSTFTVTTDLTSFTFDANAPVTEVVREHNDQPADGYVNDVISTLENHVYVGSHSSSIVYMSKSGNFADFTFSSPRLATDGWQFVLDDFMVGFSTNLTGESGQESMVFFAERDWIYRVAFVDLSTDSTIAQLASIKPIIVSSGQGAVSQELIAKVKNSIIYINSYNELLELGSVENISTVQQTPLSDPIKPDFLAANFTDGAIRFWRNNLYVTAPASGRTFILAFREDQRGSRRFWQPPQLLPIGPLSDFGSNLIGHDAGVQQSYTMFTSTNDNGQPISYKAHFAYNNYGSRDKMKNFNRYFTELYLTSNATITLFFVFEYLGSKNIQNYSLKGTDTKFLFVPNPAASLGVNALGTSPLGVSPIGIDDFIKYRRFKKIKPIDFFEMQTRFECDEVDARFQILCHGPDTIVSKNSPLTLND